MSIKLAMIIQRYGEEINGGAELHCRVLAKKLSEFYEVEILTTRAKDYETWQPYFPEGVTQTDGITVRRFNNFPKGSRQALREIRHRVSGRTIPQRIRKLVNYVRGERSVHHEAPKLFLQWLKIQGPYCPDLIQYIQSHGEDYGVLIFFTALYYPTACGVQVLPSKSILIPTVHDEKAMYYPGYEKVMQSPEWLFYNTNSERVFAEKLFSNARNKNVVAGIGIDVPAVSATNSTLGRYGIKSKYMVYVGRLDKLKGTKIAIDYFLKYKSSQQQPLQMVIIGKGKMKPVINPDIIYTGFISDEEKFALMGQAEALILPSAYESLSLVVLESMALEVPVLVNRKSEVLKDHIERSDAGFTFTNYREFKSAVDYLLTDKQGHQLKASNGRNYIQKYYSWPDILEKFHHAITDITSRNS